jgi:hypothetical protein
MDENGYSPVTELKPLRRVWENVMQAFWEERRYCIGLVQRTDFRRELFAFGRVVTIVPADTLPGNISTKK